jgi:hypothetical protein
MIRISSVLEENANAGKLTWGGNPYTLSGPLTLRMKEGKPIAFTTL